MPSLYEQAITVLERAAEFLPDVPEHVVEELKLPQRIVETHFPVAMDDGSVRLFTGFRIQHSNARGPYKGGIRFHTNVSQDEVQSLAFWMAMKTSVIDIPFGGGKGGVIVNAKELSEGELERLSRAYMRTIASMIGPNVDVPAPDVDTNAKIMRWMRDEYETLTGAKAPAVITGKPVEEGGSEGREEATGLGGAYLLREVAKTLGKEPKNVSVAVQGFGNVGSWFAHFAHEFGFTVVAVSDSKTALYDEAGLDVPALIEFKKDHASFAEYGSGTKIPTNKLLTLPVNVLAPAALEGALTNENAENVQARAILELSNGPTTPEADAVFKDRNITVVPDILANAGGVTVSYFEWYQNVHDERWDVQRVHVELEKKMTAGWEAVTAKANALQTPLRDAAFVIAVERIATAMQAPASS